LGSGTRQTPGATSNVPGIVQSARGPASGETIASAVT
jgi:hypothetical protein